MVFGPQKSVFVPFVLVFFSSCAVECLGKVAARGEGDFTLGRTKDRIFGLPGRRKLYPVIRKYQHKLTPAGCGASGTHHTARAGSSFDLRTLLPTYNQGVKNYNSILRSLVNDLDTSAETTSDAVFFQEILQYSTSSLNGFSQCATLATTKRDAFAAEEVKLVSQLSTKQQSLQAKEQERVKQQQKLNSARKQLSTQTARQRSAIKTLSDTESALRRAEKKLKNAKKCIRVRRKRSFWKKLWKGITSPFRLLNRLCGKAINRLTGALKGARRARDQARAVVNNQRSRVNTAKQQVASAQIKLNQLVQAKTCLLQQIKRAKIEIAEFRAQHKKIVDLKDKLGQVSTHLAAVKAPYGPSISAIQKSQKLSVLDKVEGLLSMESLIGQLQDVAKGLSGSAGSVPRFMQITNAEKQRLKSQIEAFKEKLRQLEEDVDTNAVDAVEDFE